MSAPAPRPASPGVLATASALGVVFHAVTFEVWSPYGHRAEATYRPVLALAICFLFIAPMVLTYWRRLPVKTAPTAILLGMCLSNALLILWDTRDDPTNHNLWPFEFVGILLLSAPAYLGSLVGRSLRRHSSSDADS